MTETTPKTKTTASLAVIVGFGLVGIGAVLAAAWFSLFGQPRASPSLEQLTVDVTATIQQYWRASPPERPAKLPDLIAQAKKRKMFMAALINADPKKFLDLALPQGQTLSLPPDVQAHLELHAIRQGRLEIIHRDNFESKRSTNEFFIISDDGLRHQLRLIGTNPSLKDGSSVKAIGVELDSTLVTDASVSGNIVVSETPLVVGPKKVMAIVYDVADAPMITDPNWWRGKIFTDPNSVNAYYQENSFGNLSFIGNLNPQGDLYGPYRVSDLATQCSSEGLNEARQQALQDGAVFSGYDAYIYIGWFSVLACGGQAGEQIGNAVYSYSGQNFFVVAHELGHVFGTGHANGTTEYADPFDVMGDYGLFRHMSTPRKAQLGWYQPGDLPEITTSGTHSIQPVEEPSASPKGLKIYAGLAGAVPQFYYLEYRHPFGQYFDNFAPTEPVVNGVSIRLARDTNTLSSTWLTMLVDAVPGTSSYLDAPFQVGQTFTDAARGVQVTTTGVALDRSSATVSITLTCARFNPSIAASPGFNWARPGDRETYQLTVTNNDTAACGSSTFAVAPVNLPAGWTQDPALATVTLLANQSAVVEITVTSPATATNGIIVISQRATNQSAPSLQGTGVIQYRVDSIAPTVTITNPVEGATLNQAGSVNIASTTTDNYLIETQTVFIDGQSVRSCDQGVSSCTYDWDLSNVGIGTHSVRYTSTDGAGNVGEDIVTVTIATDGGGCEDLNHDGRIGPTECMPFETQ